MPSEASDSNTASKTATPKESPKAESSGLKETPKAEASELKEASQETTANKKLSPAGKRAMQGDYGPVTREPMRDVKTPGPSESQESKSLNSTRQAKSSEGQDPMLNNTKERQAALEGVKEQEGHWIKEQGRASERADMAHLENQGEQVADLNELETNFPLLDVSSNERFQSVKVKSVDAQPAETTVNNYRHDFEKLLDRQKAKKAAVALHEHSADLQAQEAWPSDLRKNASASHIADYIQEKGELAVPDDHVSVVQDNIRQMARDIPERYGLENSKDLDKDIESLVARIKPMGIASTEIGRLQAELRQ